MLSWVLMEEFPEYYLVVNQQLCPRDSNGHLTSGLFFSFSSHYLRVLHFIWKNTLILCQGLPSCSNFSCTYHSRIRLPLEVFSSIIWWFTSSFFIFCSSSRWCFKVFVPSKKYFCLSTSNACDIPYSQLPRPCLKRDEISIKIPEEYKVGLEGCKNHLHGRLVLSKGDNPIKVGDSWSKLVILWKPIGGVW